MMDAENYYGEKQKHEMGIDRKRLQFQVGGHLMKR